MFDILRKRCKHAVSENTRFSLLQTLGKSLIVIHSEEHQHALKEVDAAALAVVDDAQKVVEIFRYVMEGKL